MDKVVHLLVYYIFAVLGYRSLANKGNYVYMCLAIIAYGGLLELGQSYIPGRDMSGYDFLANTLGVMLGAAVVSRRR
jgi:VanZ family protein